MLKEGDKVLVCISGSSASLCLLHVLRQFVRVRGLHVELGAVSIGDNVGLDPRALMLYMKALGVNYIFEQSSSSSETLKVKLGHVARKRGYNVLALANTLDKVADDFLTSVLHKGRLHATQARTRNSEGDLRIIRPFIYTREGHLEDFSIHKQLPSRPSKILTRALDGSNSILKVQAVINPHVYENIKHALKPLLSLKLESNKLPYDLRKSSFYSRE